MNFKEDNLSYKQLLFDPNNYRFQDSTDFIYADEKRFHEEGVQERAFKRLKKEESVLQLKNSIKTNGFIPIERLVVRSYKFSNDRFVVLEGNRRLAAIHWIADDYDAGVEIPESLHSTLQTVPVVIVEDSGDPAFYESLMGVRHVSGISQWGGYQRAKLVVALKDNHNLSSANVADRLAMSAQEVNRRYRAFKALQQMQNDEEFGGATKADMYPIFHEAVSLPVVRDWLNWEENKAAFSNETQLREFYGLITVNNDDNDQNREPKITSYSQVRELRDILPNPEAKRILLDPSRGFFDAVSVAKREELSRSWSTQVAEAISALQSLSVFDLQQFTEEDILQIKKVSDVASQLVENHRKLNS